MNGAFRMGSASVCFNPTVATSTGATMMWKTGKYAVLGVIGFSVAGFTAGTAQADGYGWRSDRSVTVVKKIYVRDGRRWPRNNRRVVHVYHTPQPVRVVHHNSAPRSAAYGDRTVIGGLIGAAVGALAGNTIGRGSGRVAAIIGGGIIGAIVGGNVGRSMDRMDAVEAQNALETAPTGQTVSWRNPDSGSEYTVTPTRTYREETGRYCREFTTWGWIDGYEEKLHGTACREPDGTWRRVNG
jgi:surface antigen